MLTVTVYTTPSCIKCRMTGIALDKAGIPWTHVDVTENEAARAYVTDELGYSEAPVVVVDDNDHWSGFRLDEIARLARAAAQVF